MLITFLNNLFHLVRFTGILWTEPSNRCPYRTSLPIQKLHPFHHPPVTSTSTAARIADTPTSPDLIRDRPEPDPGPEIDPDPSTVRYSLRVLDSLDRLSTAEQRALEDWWPMATDSNNFSSTNIPTQTKHKTRMHTIPSHLKILFLQTEKLWAYWPILSHKHHYDEMEKQSKYFLLQIKLFFVNPFDKNVI